MNKMKEKNKTLLKNVGIFTVSSFGSKLLSFLLVPLYTYILSTKEYGTADVLSTTVSLAMPILTLSISDSVLRFTMDDVYTKQDVISSAIRVLWKSSLLLVIILLITFRLGIFNLDKFYYIFIFISFVLNVLNNIFNLYLKGKGQISIIATAGILNTIVTCISNILFLVVFKYGVNGYLLANISGILVTVAYQYIFGKIYNDISVHTNRLVTRNMIIYSLPLIPNSLAWWINSASDRYFLIFMRGISENGIYSLAYKIPTILSTVQNIFYNAWSISAIKEFDKLDTDSFFGNNYSLYSFISLMVCSTLIILNIPIAQILYASDFFEAWRCVPFLLVGTMFNGLSLFEGCIYASVKKTKIVSLTTIIGAVCNIVCNIIFIKFWGGVGAAFATMMGYFVTWILRTFFMKSIIFMKVKWRLEIISYILLFIQAYLGTFAVAYFFQIVIGFILFMIRFLMGINKHNQKAPDL